MIVCIYGKNKREKRITLQSYIIERILIECIVNGSDVVVVISIIEK